MSADTGATPPSPNEAPAAQDSCFIVYGDGTRSPGRKHIFSWVWKNGQMTNEVQCSVCLLVKDADPAGGSGDAS